MKVEALVLCSIFLLTVYHSFLPVSADSGPSTGHTQPSLSYPEVLSYTFNYTFDYDTISLNPQIKDFNHTSGSVIKTNPVTVNS